MSMTKSLLLIAALGGVAAADDGTVSGTVDAKPSKFLKETIVYIKEVPGAHAAPMTFEIDQKALTFDPHIVIAAVGDTVKFHNHDNVDHNVTSPDGKYDLGTWGVGAAKEHVYTAQGVFSQICKLHPEMLAYVFVGQNRFAAVVADNGKFIINNVPAGTYELDVWNPKLKAAPQKITVTAKGNASVKFSLAR
jgi:plastocyanin